MPFEILLINSKAPVFKKPLIDVKLKVNDEYKLVFPDMIDQDLDDTPSLSKIEFGKASDFITGDFP